MTYSKNPGTSTQDQYHVQEVITSLADSKQLAKDYAANKKWSHRMTVKTVGNINVKPYHPVYLDGLPNGLSGYWTVLSVKHVFGGMVARYMLEIEVGTDVLGDTDPNAAKNAGVRDVQAEIAGQSTGAPGPTIYVDVQLSPNGSSLVPDYGQTNTTVANVPSATAIPEGLTGDMYAVTPPDLSQTPSEANWVARPGSTVTNV